MSYFYELKDKPVQNQYEGEEMMEVKIRDVIHSRCELLTSLINRLENKINELPEGTVHTKRIGKGVYYYLSDGNSQERILRKDETELKEKLLQKKYLMRVIEVSRNEIKVLLKFSGKYPEHVAEDVYEQLPDEAKNGVKPIIPTDEQYVARWLSEPYTKKPISDDVPVYITKKGERVRSKSEMIIANMLYDYGIPYKYECPLLVGGEIFHPDFTILRLSDRQVVYYEHCGKMGDPGYVEDMIDRSRKYAFDGIFQGDRLFYTFESAKQPLDVRVITEMIENNFR